MANPILLGVDLSLPTYAWSAGANASYPVSNLKNYYPDIVSKSAATTDAQTLTITFSASTSADLCVIEGQNFASLGATSVKLQYNDGSWQDAATFDIINNNIQQKTVVGAGTQWRILFTKGSALSAAPQLGNIFLGTKLQFETTQVWGFHTNMPAAVRSRSRALDGRARVAENFGVIRKHKISFTKANLQSDAFINLYAAFLDTVGGKPFYYIDNNSYVYLVVFEKDFNPYEAVNPNQNTIADLAMESVLAG